MFSSAPVSYPIAPVEVILLKMTSFISRIHSTAASPQAAGALTRRDADLRGGLGHSHRSG